MSWSLPGGAYPQGVAWVQDVWWQVVSCSKEEVAATEVGEHLWPSTGQEHHRGTKQHAGRGRRRRTRTSGKPQAQPGPNKGLEPTAPMVGLCLAGVVPGAAAQARR